MPYQVQSYSRHIPISILTPSAFAPFGEVIQNPRTHNNQPSLSTIEANQGTATKWLGITNMQSSYHTSPSQKPAELAMNMFVCRPRKLKHGRLFNVGIMERHPYTPQTFVPMGLGKEDKGTAYLVIVAPTLPYDTWDRAQKDELRAYSKPSRTRDNFGPPDLENLKAFIVGGGQAVTYGAGTWHAPMVVLGEREVEFVVVQYANGFGKEDCQEVEIGVEGRGDGVEVDVGEGGTGNVAAATAKL